MDKKTYLSSNIKFLRSLENISQPHLAKEVGCSRDNIASYERGAEPKFSILKNIVNYFHVSFDDILNIDLSKDELGDNKNIAELKHKKEPGSAPYYSDLPVSAGNAGLNTISHEEKPSGYIKIPGIVVEFFFPTIGYSMLPKIQAGDIIGVNRLDVWEHIDPDKTYLIITIDDRMIKHLRIDLDDDAILWCVSDNYKEFKINKSDILKIFHVIYVFHGELL